MPAIGLPKVPRETKTLRELTLETMREAILGFHYRPGERLVERSLCEQLGVSRSVVREVLRHLEAEGLIETIGTQGPAVARLDPDRAAEIYEIRALLEGLAAEACALRATADDVALLTARVAAIAEAWAEADPRAILKATHGFYESLFALSGKHTAWNIVQSLNARINVLRAMTISTPGRAERALAEMRAILAAIAAGDGPAARQAAADHVRIAQALVVAHPLGQD